MRLYGLLSLSSILATNIIFALSSIALADKASLDNGNSLLLVRGAKIVQRSKFVLPSGHKKRRYDKVRRFFPPPPDITFINIDNGGSNGGTSDGRSDSTLNNDTGVNIDSSNNSNSTTNTTTTTTNTTTTNTGSM